MTEQAVGTILSIAGKIFARILLNRLSIHITPEVVPETQCGFRGNRDLCRIKLLPVTHVLVDTWMLTVKPVYKLLNTCMSDDLKRSTNTHVTPFSLTFKA